MLASPKTVKEFKKKKKQVPLKTTMRLNRKYQYATGVNAAIAAAHSSMEDNLPEEKLYVSRRWRDSKCASKDARGMTQFLLIHPIVNGRPNFSLWQQQDKDEKDTKIWGKMGSFK